MTHETDVDEQLRVSRRLRPTPQYRTVNWLKMADAHAWHRRQPKILAGVERIVGAEKP